MVNKDYIEKFTEEVLSPIVKSHNIELVDVEFVKELGNYYLRAYIDTKDGVTVNECEVVSREFSAILDEKDPIVEPYILEVSSPGLDRPIKKEKDFERSIGKDVEFKLYKALDGQKEFVGTLKSFTSTDMNIEIDGKIITFERNTVAHIRLSVTF